MNVYKNITVLLLLSFLLVAPHCIAQERATSEQVLGEIHAFIPNLRTGNAQIDKAFRIAMGDLFTNIQDYQDGLLSKPAPVILAGLDYGRPWTRDASINSWNAGSLVVPDTAKNTLLSVVVEDEEDVRIGGQYWDAVVWISAAWHHYLCTGDREFLELAYRVTQNSLAYFERTEFNSEYGLFRGLGWSDGVAAYPDKYANTQGNGAAWSWPEYNPDKKALTGYGIPMMAISTNCLYFNAYRVAEKMAKELNVDVRSKWTDKAKQLKQAINKHLWNEETGLYRFYIDGEGSCELQEALGNSYAILFGVTDKSQTMRIFQNAHVTPAGVPCGWPPLERYKNLAPNSFARHNGTVWPQIQGFWAHAAAANKQIDIFSHELFNLANHAVRDMQFAEIYHPITGEQYGGFQERGNQGISLWSATQRQTWAATAYLRMVLYGLVGMRITTDEIRFEPCVPKEFNQIRLFNVKRRNQILNVTIVGHGTNIESVTVNGSPSKEAVIPLIQSGNQAIEIILTASKNHE